MSDWLESQLNERGDSLTSESCIMEKLKQIKNDKVMNDIKYIIENYPTIAFDSLNQLIEYSSVDKLKEVVAVLSQKISEIEPITEGTFEAGANNVSTPKLQQQQQVADASTMNGGGEIQMNNNNTTPIKMDIKKTKTKNNSK